MTRIRQLQTKAKAAAKLWERLEVTEEDLSNHPSITPILMKSLGSTENVIAALRSSDAKEALELLRIWDQGSKLEHKTIPFEGYCLAAKSTPKKMMGILIQAILDSSKEATELMLAVAHPEIVQKTIKIAKTNKGADERRIILQNRGTLPSPKNQVFNNFGNMTQDNRKQIAVNQLDEDNERISFGIEKFNADNMAKIGEGHDKAEIIDVVDESV